MGALIITAELAPDDFAWLEGLRRAHYPMERNQVPVHLTMFHALPPSALEEVRRRLSIHAAGPPPQASIEGLMDLGGGVAFRVASDELDSIRDDIADHFHGMIGMQDAGGWRPHITIQNKVRPRVARALLAELGRDFRSRPLGISALAVHQYLDGPWETLGRYAFRGR